MTRLKYFLNKYWFGICVVLILLLSAVLRFINFDNRWGLAYDQAHDAIVARYALEAHKIPLVGPFSSAGPFQTGGEWYWFIMAATAIYPYSVLTPWLVLTFLSVIFVLTMILLGKEMISKQFGIILGLLSAVSTAQIAQSTNLTNQSPVALLALFAIWSIVRYAKKGGNRYLFFLGFSTSLAATIHLQGVSLVLLILATLLFTGLPKKNALIFLCLGFMLPLIPLLVFDIKSNFINSKGILQYYLHDQYKISFDVLGRRWLTYAGIFWPEAWAHVIGGEKIWGYLLITALFLVTLVKGWRKKIPKEWYIIFASFLLIVGVMKYVRTPLFDSYLVFLHPFIIILTGWVIFNLKEKSLLIGLLLLSGIIVGSLSQDIKEIKETTNSTALRAKYWRDLLVGQYPNKKFAIYDYEYKSAGYSLPMVLFLEAKGLLNDNGYRIGFGTLEASTSSAHTEVKGNQMGFSLWDLNSSSSAELLKAGWSFINPSKIYYATEEWYSRAGK